MFCRKDISKPYEEQRWSVSQDVEKAQGVPVHTIEIEAMNTLCKDRCGVS